MFGVQGRLISVLLLVLLFGVGPLRGVHTRNFRQVVCRGGSYLIPSGVAQVIRIYFIPSTCFGCPVALDVLRDVVWLHAQVLVESVFVIWLLSLSLWFSSYLHVVVHSYSTRLVDSLLCFCLVFDGPAVIHLVSRTCRYSLM
jgi:hypothetical protein